MTPTQVHRLKAALHAAREAKSAWRKAERRVERLFASHLVKLAAKAAAEDIEAALAARELEDLP